MSQEVEKEKTIYVEVGNWDGLSQADYFEDQMQYEGKLANGKFHRLRISGKEVDAAQAKHVYTVKAPQSQNSEVRTMVEFNKEVPVDFYKTFRYAADHYLKKTRFTFKSTSVKLKSKEGEVVDLPTDLIRYEVDVFQDAEGNRLQLAKIDVELQDFFKYIEEKHPALGDYRLVLSVSHLPFKPFNIISPETGTDEQKKLIEDFWRKARCEVK